MGTSDIPSESEVFGWFEVLSNWGRWGADDQLGTLNYITPAHRVAAAQLIQVGTTVSRRQTTAIHDQDR
jgi:hypothetical protein